MCYAIWNIRFPNDIIVVLPFKGFSLCVISKMLIFSIILCNMISATTFNIKLWHSNVDDWNFAVKNVYGIFFNIIICRYTFSPPLRVIYSRILNVKNEHSFPCQLDDKCQRVFSGQKLPLDSYLHACLWTGWCKNLILFIFVEKCDITTTEISVLINWRHISTIQSRPFSFLTRRIHCLLFSPWISGIYPTFKTFFFCHSVFM